MKLPKNKTPSPWPKILELFSLGLFIFIMLDPSKFVEGMLFILWCHTMIIRCKVDEMRWN